VAVRARVGQVRTVLLADALNVICGLFGLGICVGLVAAIVR
jgi:hypothetical protein